MRPFLNYVNLIDCSFSTTNAADVILGRSYVGRILPLVQRPLGFHMDNAVSLDIISVVSQAKNWKIINLNATE